MFSGLGIWELLLIFLIVLLFFGAKRLPEIGGSLGKGIREFKQSVKGLDEEVKELPDGEASASEPSASSDSGEGGRQP